MAIPAPPHQPILAAEPPIEAINGLLRAVTWLDYERVLTGRQLYAGAAWWSLTRPTLESAMRLLATDHALRRYMRSIACPDECAVHTAVGAILDERAAAGTARTTTRRGSTGTRPTSDGLGPMPHPEPLTPEGIQRARNEGWWFARKFESGRRGRDRGTLARKRCPRTASDR